MSGFASLARRWSLVALGLCLGGWAADAEVVSSDFSVRVAGVELPVYTALVDGTSAEARERHRVETGSDTATTSFSSFDLAAPTEVLITAASAVSSVRILPSSRGVHPQVDGSTIRFTVDRPGPLVVEVNGNEVGCLQLFANPPEVDVPAPGDPHVLYYGPGVHVVESVKVPSGTTVYLAAGAVVQGHFGPGSPPGPMFDLSGDHITLRGRGILDGESTPRHTRSLIRAHGSDLRIEGIVLRGSSLWNLHLAGTDRALVDNVKIFGWRDNSDGIDINNSRNVTVTNCYLRTLDDLVVVKTGQKGAGPSERVAVTGCVLWNEFAHALSLGAELREPVDDVRFADCDIVHDRGREWLLRVYHCDAAPVTHVTFENLRIEEARRVASVWIGSAIWSKDPDRGTVDGVVFRNIRSVAPSRSGPWADLVGFDAGHLVKNVTFDRFVVGGQSLDPTHLRSNAFVTGTVLGSD